MSGRHIAAHADIRRVARAAGAGVVDDGAATWPQAASDRFDVRGDVRRGDVDEDVERPDRIHAPGSHRVEAASVVDVELDVGGAAETLPTQLDAAV